MAYSVLSPPFLFLFLLFSNSGGILKLTHSEDESSWCVAKAATPDEQLQDNINYACDNLMDCTIIQAGGTCFYPNDLVSHASVVMNLYYQKGGRKYWNCDFKNSGIISITDPSYGDCRYDFTS